MTVLASGIAVIADSDRDELHFVGVDFAVSHVALQPGDEPGRVVEGPAGTVFVALRRGGGVAQVDVSSHTVTRLAACATPRGLAWRADVQQLLVACSDGELATLDFSAGTPALTSRHVLDDLRDVVVMQGQVLVTTFREANVYALDAQGNPVLWAKPLGLQDGVHDLSPEVAWRALAAPSGLLLVHQRADNNAIAQSTPCFSPWGSSGFSSGSSTLEPAISVMTQGRAVDLAVLPNLALPVDVAASADGKSAAVVFAGAAQVERFDLSTQVVSATPIAVDGQPVSAAFSGSTLLVYTREPAKLIGYDANGSITTELPLSALSMRDTGHDLFHVETVNGIACASCHPEATEDGHVWNLPKGLRRTPSLRGGIKGTEPFHWDGEEADMGALVSDVFVERMGGLSEDGDHVSALLDWVDAQPKRAAPGDLDVAAVTRGAAAFTALGCTSCHAGEKGTNNGSSDVGTGGAFQVPRLVELAYRAPFFHDGHVASLAARFTAAGGSGHTGTQGLTADQISDLVAYLKSR
jgi:DNA-binding beta-propeller fold protein YncE